MPTLQTIAARLDELLATRDIPDYPPAVNGIQLENRAEIRGVAAAVDCSQRTIDGAIEADANLLIVHHGLLWGGVQPIRGAFYERLYRLLSNGIAVYSSHLPLDAHPEVGNNVLLARELGLEPSGRFARFQSLEIGVRGEAEIPTRELVARSDSFARRHGGRAIATEFIVGEGPHWTAVDAPELGIVIIYAGHYATETLGVQALGRLVEREFGLPCRFVEAPTGL